MRLTALLFFCALAQAQFPPDLKIGLGLNQNPSGYAEHNGEAFVGFDPNDPSSVNAGFNAAISTLSPNGTLIISRGTYVIGNSGGAIIFTNFTGHIIVEPGAQLVFTDNTQPALLFFGGSPVVTGLNLTYQTLPTAVTGVYVVVFRNTQNAVLEDSHIVGSGGVGLQFADSVRPRVHNVTVTNTMLGGVQIQNCQNAEIDGVTTDTTGDDGVAFISYINDSTQYMGATAANIRVRNTKGRGIKVAGLSNVEVTGFVVDGTAGSAVICLTDSTYGTSTPSGVVFGQGAIRNVGTITPLSGSPSGIEFENVGSCSFNNIQVIGSASAAAAVPGVAGSAPAGEILLSNIRVTGAGSAQAADGFDVGAARLTISGSSAEFVPGIGFNFSGGGVLRASDLTAFNVSLANTTHEAFWFGGTGFSSVSNLTLIDTQSFPTAYVIGGSAGQTGVLDGAITHFANGMSPTYAFPAGSFDIFDVHNK
jgi:hypothetical protein